MNSPQPLHQIVEKNDNTGTNDKEEEEEEEEPQWLWLLRVFQYLDAASLGTVCCVSRAFRRLARSNAAGWPNLCHHQLWHNKILDTTEYDDPDPDPNHDDDDSKNSAEYGSRRWLMMHAYRDSVLDSKRTWLKESELVYDYNSAEEDEEKNLDKDVPKKNNADDDDDGEKEPEQKRRRKSRSIEEESQHRHHRIRTRPNIWSFRFKACAGKQWVRTDPWHRGEPCRKFIFLRNGTVQEISSTFTTSITTATPTPSSSPHTFSSSIASSSSSSSSLPRMTWSRVMEQESRRSSSRQHDQVRIRHRFQEEEEGDMPGISDSMVPLPTFCVKRIAGNWGFVLENCWSVFANFDLPPKIIKNNSLSPMPLPLPLLHPSIAALQDEEHWTVTSDMQWREAFLYNIASGG